ncbi:peptidase metallopeptidase [Methylobacterium aquaticum]|nr:Hint domain-containing protein [Methylobacterium aquaticum]QRE74312.1 peptidase metallopeptidase [Methylobacterium aquaticum]
MANATGMTREQEVTYLSGVNADGTLAGTAYATYKGDTPDTYDTASSQFHWGAVNAAGTAGGTLNYMFDPAANWTATEQAALAGSLNLWSAVANISFKQTTSEDDANIGFTRNAEGKAYAESASTPHPVGTSVITPPVGGQAKVSMDIGETARATGKHGSLNDFQAGGSGYGAGTTVHEVGHALGLGHGGPYNNTNTLSQQYGPYDNEVSTLMSYFNPHNPVKYDSPITGTNWTTPDGTNHYAATWMPVDIDAIQRLYGAQTSGPLNQAQTFGYNTTITGSLKPYFDFTVNTKPVLTLYNTATSGNALDLSQSSETATVNLNAGTYSSAFGMTNNIAIYDTTYIQRLACGAGNDVCTVNLAKDNTIDGGAGTNTAVFSGNRADYTIAQANGATIVTRTASASLATRPTGVTDTLTNFQTLRFDDQAVAVCFTTGTRLRTARGEVAVEDLQVGDRAVTASGALRPVTWIGHRDLDGRGRTLPASQQPVRLRAGAFGPGLPARDLRLSPGHPVLVGADADGAGGHLVPVMCLINGTSIVRELVSSVTYWHVELDAHDILLAEGLPAESYLDWGDRPFFSEGSDHALHNPDFVVPGLSARCRPVAVDGPVVEAERARLSGVFAAALGAACAWDAPERYDWLAA